MIVKPMLVTDKDEMARKLGIADWGMLPRPPEADDSAVSQPSVMLAEEQLPVSATILNEATEEKTQMNDWQDTETETEVKVDRLKKVTEVTRPTEPTLVINNGSSSGESSFVAKFGVYVLTLEIGILSAMMWLPVVESSKGYADTLFGVLLMHVTSIVFYWYGSSFGSQQKQDIITRLTKRS